MTMNTYHRERLEREIAQATSLLRGAKYEEAFRHLERAHMLGRAHVRWQVLSHWLMLKVAFRSGEAAAAIDQVVRMVLGAVGSAIGRVPIGNTGGRNVSMYRRMPIPPELLEIMEGRRIAVLTTSASAFVMSALEVLLSGRTVRRQARRSPRGTCSPDTRARRTCHTIVRSAFAALRVPERSAHPRCSLRYPPLRRNP